MLDIKGCVVTAEAMSCQTKIVDKIVEKKGYYVLAVKDNQRRLAEEIEETTKW